MSVDVSHLEDGMEVEAEFVWGTVRGRLRKVAYTLRLGANGPTLRYLPMPGGTLFHDHPEDLVRIISPAPPRPDWRDELAETIRSLPITETWTPNSLGMAYYQGRARGLSEAAAAVRAAVCPDRAGEDK